MPQPVINYADYLSGVKSPFERAMEGYNFGESLKEREARAALAKAKAEEVERQRRKQMNMESELAVLAEKEDANADDYTKMITKYPELAEHFNKTIETMGSEELQNRQSQAMGVFAALNSGQTEIAKELLTDQITAAENSGDEQEKKNAEILLKLVEASPESAKASAGLFLASTTGDKFSETWAKLQEEGRASDLAEVDMETKLADLDLTQAQTMEIISKIGKGPEDTANIKDWKAYQELVKIDPEKAKEFANLVGITSQTTATDIDDYVADAEKAYLEANPNATEMPPGLKNKARREFKRAQSQEVRANRLAEREVDAETAMRIAKNTKLGTQFALIETEEALTHARGDQTPEEKREVAKVRMNNNLKKMAQAYLDLDSMGGIVNVENDTADNIWARFKSSDQAQAFQEFFGTNEQSLRNVIKSIQPLAIQDIRKATEMSARGLDSERELDFYLKAATNLKGDIQSNMAALVALDEAYGDGQISSLLKERVDPSKLSRIQKEGKEVLGGSLMTPEERQKAMTERQKSGYGIPENTEKGYMRFLNQGAE